MVSLDEYDILYGNERETGGSERRKPRHTTLGVRRRLSCPVHTSYLVVGNILCPLAVFGDLLGDQVRPTILDWYGSVVLALRVSWVCPTPDSLSLKTTLSWGPLFFRTFEDSCQTLLVRPGTITFFLWGNTLLGVSWTHLKTGEIIVGLNILGQKKEK